MRIIYHKKFVKQYSKQLKEVKDKFIERQKLFIAEPFSPILNNHKLNGDYYLCRSINITGDIRAIFEISEDFVEFIAIGTHSELYS